MSFTSDAVPENKARTATQRLLYRWFVEYNPLYLLSAMLVLVGMTALWIRADGSEDGIAKLSLGPLVSELYALSLIGGAALLLRIGHRRPAVMLGLLAVLYQGDLTLLTERCEHLGTPGVVAVVLWLGLFGAKIFALGRALRLKISSSFAGIAGAGAITLAALPVAMTRAGGDRGTLLWLVAFGLVAAMMWTKREVESVDELTAWQATVLRRSLVATWCIWGAALATHFWIEIDGFRSGYVLALPAAALLLTHVLRSELKVWASIAFVVALAAPFFGAREHAAILVMATAMLVRRGLTASQRVERLGETRTGPIYRHGQSEIGKAPVTEVFAVVDERARARYLGGALFTTWLTAGELVHEPRSMLLAAMLVLATIALVLRTRQAWSSAAAPSLAVIPLVAPLTRVFHVLTAPQLGAIGIGIGFAMLGGSIAVSYSLRDTSRAVPDQA